VNNELEVILKEEDMDKFETVSEFGYKEYENNIKPQSG
jgi:hypothetical protein